MGESNIEKYLRGDEYKCPQNPRPARNNPDFRPKIPLVGITPAETVSNGAGLGFHRIHEAMSCGVHATRIYGPGAKNDAEGKDFDYAAGNPFIYKYLRHDTQLFPATASSAYSADVFGPIF